MPKIGGVNRVILFATMVPLDSSSGGTIVCREHLRSIAATAMAETHVYAPAGRGQGDGRDFPTAVGAVFHPLELVPPSADFLGMPAITRHPFSMERQAAENWLVDRRFCEIAEEIRPDVIIIDYLFTALFIPSAFYCDAPVVIITLNREREFYRDQRKLGRVPPQARDSLLAEWRLGRFENEVHAKSDRIVVLCPHDTPRHRQQAARTEVIEPMLQEHARKWRPTGSANIFFVGNISHYPNFAAVRWLCQSLAPALASCAPWVRLTIIGADTAEVPQTWLQPNVDLLGRSTAEEVLQHFTGCGIFIAPIENSFGSKIKILEALAHATPLLATAQALTGVPGAAGIPLFRLDDPRGAAELVASLLHSPERLAALSQRMEEIRTSNLSRTRSAWPSLIEEVASAPAVSRRFRPWSGLRPRRAPTACGPVVEVGASSYHWIHSEGLGSLEQLNGRPLRWTAESASLTLLLDPAKPPRWLRVLTWDIAPEGETRLQVFANDSPVLEGWVVGGRPVERVVRLPPLRGCGELTLRFSTPGFRIAGDDRVLGVALESVRVGRSWFRMKAYPLALHYWNTHQPFQRFGRRLGLLPR
ncbi:glycosyltransferase [Cyanobium gracile UHCC 0139]|uniref:Glycosyltransferase n=1 Tax=Cyanobium gracile UHCC 0139 TaxID=3110308 RepID=A0ABU5RR67_9CYAN|nr:glycosyltransferase [Cyanobium gracile]MEA5390272.1 glycosyltransferase [Cyanobium gracile UHCC 0139]